MTSNVELLPPPKWLLDGFTDPTIEMLCDYTRDNVEHYIASRDAEIEALRAELREMRRTMAGEFKRAEQLAEALRKVVELDEEDGDSLRNARAISRAALRNHDQEEK